VCLESLFDDVKFHGALTVQLTDVTQVLFINVLVHDAFVMMINIVKVILIYLLDVSISNFLN